MKLNLNHKKCNFQCSKMKVYNELIFFFFIKKNYKINFSLNNSTRSIIDYFHSTKLILSLIQDRECHLISSFSTRPIQQSKQQQQ